MSCPSYLWDDDVGMWKDRCDKPRTYTSSKYSPLDGFERFESTEERMTGEPG